MRRRLGFSLGAALVAAAMLAPAVQAGGWAVVTLDQAPVEVRAGQALTLGFMVRQHGVTPTNSVHAVLTGANKASGETVQAEAWQEGAVGHFVVEVTFPSTGAWQWQIAPQPFEATRFEPLTVLAADAPAPQRPQTSVVMVPPSAADEGALAPAPATPAGRTLDAGLLRWAAAALFATAGALVLLTQRRAFGHGRTGRHQRA